MPAGSRLCFTAGVMRTLSISLLALAVVSCSGSPQPEAEAAAKTESTGAITFNQSDDSIEVLADGKPLTTFYFGLDAPKPYLDPIRAADGTVVSRRYPMRDDVPGEAHDHPHHRGIWMTHGDVNGVDFWANEAVYAEKRDNIGNVVLKGVHEARDGFIRADFEWRDPDGEVLLTEDRLMRFAVDDDNVILDFDVTLKAETKEVKFGDTKEGMFAIRLHPTMREVTPDKQPGQGVIVNAEGLKGEKNAWGKASKWVDYSGPVDGRTYGVTIVDHPENPKHPTYWHVRAYGLFAANPFGEHDFFNDEDRDGAVTLQPGESLRFRYRVIVHPGDAAAADVGALASAWK